MKPKLLVLITCLCSIFVNAQNVNKDKTKQAEPLENTKTELVYRDIDASQIIEFEDAENPPMAPDCKPKWDLAKRKECTEKFIRYHVMRKFNTDLAAEAGVSGVIKIHIDFIIDTTGKAINITASGGPDVLNQNAIEVIGRLPNFKPATKDGAPINVSYYLPLKFQVVD